MHYLLTPTHPGLEATRILLARERLDLAGGPETAFLDAARDITPLPGPFARAVAAAARDPEQQALVMIRNPALVLDEELPDRLAAARARLAPFAGRWSLAAAGGLTPEGARVASVYATATPFLPARAIARPLIDAMPDLVLVDGGFLRQMLARDPFVPDVGFELGLILEGWLHGRAAVHLPELVAAVHGELLPRDPVKLVADLATRLAGRLDGERIETLMGALDIPRPAPDAIGDAAPGAAGARARAPRPALQAQIERTVTELAAPLSLSIVTRTRFTRPHLLRRLLASITRARRGAAELEVVLSTDLPRRRAEAAFRPLAEEFVELELRLIVNRPRGPSRVTNLLGGLRAARNDYVAVVDDDDYVDILAFDHMARARFLGARPLMAAECVVHEEEWVETGAERHVLIRAEEKLRHPAAGWRQMFDGVNRLPVSGLIVPRERLRARLSAHALRRDLSEDYALHLLVLTDPELPPIVELGGPFVHISLRPREGHSMTMTDRRPWARDIALHLADVMDNPGIAGPGLWQLLAARGPGPATERSAIDALHAALERSRAELRLARLEATQLRRLLAEVAEQAPATSSSEEAPSREPSRSEAVTK